MLSPRLSMIGNVSCLGWRVAHIAPAGIARSVIATMATCLGLACRRRTTGRNTRATGGILTRSPATIRWH